MNQMLSRFGFALLLLMLMSGCAPVVPIMLEGPSWRSECDDNPQICQDEQIAWFESLRFPAQGSQAEYEALVRTIVGAGDPGSMPQDWVAVWQDEWQGGYLFTVLSERPLEFGLNPWRQALTISRSDYDRVEPLALTAQCAWNEGINRKFNPRQASRMASVIVVVDGQIKKSCLLASRPACRWFEQLESVTDIAANDIKRLRYYARCPATKGGPA